MYTRNQNFSLDEETEKDLDYLIVIAKQTERSVSHIIRKAIKEYVKQLKKERKEV